MTILTTTTPPNYALWDSSYNGTRLYNRAECHFISFIYQSLNTRSFYVKLVARPPGRGVQKKDQTALPRCQFCGPANCTLIPSGSKKKTMPISGLPAEVFIHELFHYGPWDDEHDNFADYSPVGDLGSIGPKHKANLELILQ